MFDLLTIEEDKTAASMGWTLEYVFDVRSKQWVVQILPLMFLPPFERAEYMGQFVVNQARTGNALAIKALRLVAMPVTKKGKK